MELRHLRYFVAVAETENVSRAAARLHVSQPGLSRQIKDLEYELGFALLERTAKSVKLTEAGHVFLKESKSVLQRVEDAVASAKSTAQSAKSELHVGYAPTPTARILPATIRNFQTASPGSRVKLHDYSTEEMLSGLRSGKLELALLVKPTRSMLRGFHFEPLLKDRLCLAVPPSHAYARMRSIALKKIAGESLVSLDRKDYPEVHEFMAELFAGIKAKPRIVEEHESAASIVSAVEAGTGLALVPQTLTCSFGARVKLIPIVPSPEPLIIGAAWLDKGLSANATLFMDCARKSAQTLPEYHGK